MSSSRIGKRMHSTDVIFLCGWVQAEKDENVARKSNADNCCSPQRTVQKMCMCRRHC